MMLFRHLVRRIRRLFFRGRIEAEMAEEMRFHLEQRAADYAADDLPADEARYAAERRFGNVTSIQENAREEGSWVGLERVLRDGRLAVRHLAKSPGFTVVAIVTLAIGIGANTAIFSVINSTLLRPLAYPEPDRLVQIWSNSKEFGPYPVATGAKFKQWREDATTVDVAAIQDRVAYNLLGEGPVECVTGAEVSTNYLDVLGVRPQYGRSFRPDDEVLGSASRVVILTHEWWSSRLGGDLSVLNRTLNFNQESYRVIGILPPHALVHDSANFVVPMVFTDGEWRLNPRIPWLLAVARLRPGVTVGQATGELEAISAALEARLSPGAPFLGHQLLPMQTLLVGRSRPVFLMVFGAVALVWLIMCANLANLLLARGASRQKEMAVRRALGASAGRIVGQLLTESLVLSFCGGLMGVLVAVWGVSLLTWLIAGEIPAAMQPALDWRVLVFSLLLTGGTGILFGLWPALQSSRVNVQRNLKDDGRGATSGSRSRVQSWLIIAEVALTVCLLIGAGLLLRSFVRVLRTDPGFAAEQALVCEVSLTQKEFANAAAVVQFQRDLVREIGALPGVTAVGTSTTLPFTREHWGATIGLSARPESEHHLGVGLDYVGGDYFSAMNMTLLRGRPLNEADSSSEAARVVVISQSAAEALMPHADPLGRRIHFAQTDWEIVGVVGEVRYRQVDAAPEPRVYAAHGFNPWTICLVVRTASSPLGMIPSIRETAARLNPDQSLTNFRTLDQAVSGSLQVRRVALYLIGAFAVVAVALASLGIYGVIAYTIAQRERELSIRMALGAKRGDLLRLVLQDGMRLGLTGLVLGLLGGVLGARLIASRLYEVGAHDPLVFALTALGMLLVILVAVGIPARRAIRPSLLEMLRTG